MNITNYHAKYYAHDLLKSSTEDGIEKILIKKLNCLIDLLKMLSISKLIQRQRNLKMASNVVL